MTDNPYAELLTHCTYRPGWTLRIEGPPWLLRIDGHALDSLNPGETVRLPHMFPIPSILSVNRFYLWVAERLTDCERHESREWFKVDGMRYLDPHAPPDSLYR